MWHITRYGQKTSVTNILKHTRRDKWHMWPPLLECFHVHCQYGGLMSSYTSTQVYTWGDIPLAFLSDYLFNVLSIFLQVCTYIRLVAKGGTYSQYLILFLSPVTCFWALQLYPQSPCLSQEVPNCGSKSQFVLGREEKTFSAIFFRPSSQSRNPSILQSITAIHLCIFATKEQVCIYCEIQECPPTIITTFPRLRKIKR